jgi:hypothetical protein
MIGQIVSQDCILYQLAGEMGVGDETEYLNPRLRDVLD